MFKRVTKKQKKREEIEELGLDDFAEQGSSDSDSSSSDSEHGDSDGDEQRDSDNEEDEDGEGEDDEEEDGESEGEPPMTIEEARRNPVYVSEQSGAHACLVCPGKVLKDEDAVKVHTQSSAHKRRFDRFLETTKDSTYGTDDPRLIVEAITTLTNHPPKLTSITGVLSNRGWKRKVKMDRIRKVRATQKEMKAKYVRKRDAKRAAEAKATEAEGGKDNKNTVVEKSTKAVESKLPAKKKQKLSKEGAQGVSDNNPSPAKTVSKRKISKPAKPSENDKPPPTTSLPTTRESPKGRKSKPSSDATAPSKTKTEESERPSKSKKRKRPNKSNTQ